MRGGLATNIADAANSADQGVEISKSSNPCPLSFPLPTYFLCGIIFFSSAARKWFFLRGQPLICILAIPSAGQFRQCCTEGCVSESRTWRLCLYKTLLHWRRKDHRRRELLWLFSLLVLLIGVFFFIFGMLLTGCISIIIYSYPVLTDCPGSVGISIPQPVWLFVFPLLDRRRRWWRNARLVCAFIRDLEHFVYREVGMVLPSNEKH